MPLVSLPYLIPLFVRLCVCMCMSHEIKNHRCGNCVSENKRTRGNESENDDSAFILVSIVHLLCVRIRNRIHIHKKALKKIRSIGFSLFHREKCLYLLWVYKFKTKIKTSTFFTWHITTNWRLRSVNHSILVFYKLQTIFLVQKSHGNKCIFYNRVDIIIHIEEKKHQFLDSLNVFYFCCVFCTIMFKLLFDDCVLVYIY